MWTGVSFALPMPARVRTATSSRPLREVYGYRPEWGLPSPADQEEIVRLMTHRGPQGGSAPESEDAVG